MFGFLYSWFLFSFAYESAIQKSQHCLAWDFSLPQKMIINTPLLLPVAKLPIRSRSMVNCWRGCVARQWCFQLLKTDTRWCSLSILNYLKRIKCQEAIILRVTKIEFFLTFPTPQVHWMDFPSYDMMKQQVWIRIQDHRDGVPARRGRRPVQGTPSQGAETGPGRGHHAPGLWESPEYAQWSIPRLMSKNELESTGWPFRLLTSFCWHQMKSCVLI